MNENQQKTADVLIGIIKSPAKWHFALIHLLASLYRLAVLAGVVYLVRLVLLIGAGGWLFLILPTALFFLAVAPKYPAKE